MSLLELAPMPVLPPILTLPLILPSLRQAPLWQVPSRQAPLQQALAMATLLPILAVDWERIKKFRSILQAEYIETCSYCKKQ